MEKKVLDSMSFNFGNSIRYLYGADGVKRRVRYRTVQSGGIVPFSFTGSQTQSSGLPGIDPPLPPVTTVTTMDYCGSAIYENNVLTALLVDGGYVSFTKTGTGASAVYTPTYHFYMRDHLGSNRFVASAAGTAEQVSHYYPYWSTFYGESASDHRFKYCGKELDKMHGLDWYDSSARYYDHVLGRFHQIDPLCEKYYDVSPYVYCTNNPVKYVDLDGLFPTGIITIQHERIYMAKCPSITGVTTTTETQLTYYTFTKPAAHLLSLVSGVSERYIRNVRLEEFGLQRENNCITLGSSPERARMLVSPSYFDESNMSSEQYYDWWFREFSHEVGHIKQIERDKNLGKYLLKSFYGYFKTMSHDEAPREKEAEQGSIIYRDFRNFIKSEFKIDLNTLFISNESEEYKINQLDIWWNTYKNQGK